MPPTLVIARQRRSRRLKDLRSTRQRAQRIVLALGFLASAALVISLLSGVWIYAGLTQSLPPVEQLPLLLDPQNGLLLQPTRLYDRTGEHLLAVLSPTDSKRTYLPFAKLPDFLVKATLAAAQPDFWSSPGYRVSGWRDPLNHPTLAQRLAADLLLWDAPAGSARAIHERMLAAQMTVRYGRQQVLEWYLNSADYGRYAYGAEAAALLYLGKSASQLSLSESALLAAISQAPALNPLDAPQGIEDRWIGVLQKMMEQGWITPAEVAQAILDKPVLKDAPSQPGVGNNGIIAPAFIHSTLAQLAAQFGEGRVERGGLVIRTSLDMDLQLQVECTLRTELARLAGSVQTILTREKTACQAARLLAPLAEGETLPGALASAVLLDPRTGQVLAEVGDMDQETQADTLDAHPAGTAITPFIYLTGFSRGFNPASLAWDIPGDTPALGQVYHGPVRLRTALANDYLGPALKLLEQMSQKSVETIGASFGLDFPTGVPLLQEDFPLSPFTLAQAYGIFANSGIQAGGIAGGNGLRPVSVLKVEGVDHSVWMDTSVSQNRSVVSPQLAYMLNQVLSDETARWASLGHPNPLEIGRPAGAKISPTLDGSGAWTVGYTPRRLAVVWTGGSPADQTSQGPHQAASRSAEIWHALMQYSVSDLPAESWDTPAGIVAVSVCDPSGLLPTSVCPNVVSEIFLEGRQPVQVDNLYQTVQVNIETGLRATVFTQPELVESRTYMVVPSEAREWAVSAGIVIPPAAYDNVQKPPVLPDVNITAPEMFADGKGIIEVHGTAAGADFLSYRLEYGQGLYPQSWFQVGSDSSVPVNEGILASWDTSSLNGLYALRLMVIRQDQKVSQALVQVTLDNDPPQVAILYPSEGQEIDSAREAQVALQAQAGDPFLSKVEFYLDGSRVGEAAAPPYGLLWKARKGAHILRVVAIDRAGNAAEAAVHFSVK